MRRGVLLALVLLLLGARAEAKPAPKVVTEEDGQYLHLFLEGNPKAQAWLYHPVTGDEDDDGMPTEPVDLVVALHGAGGIPKNFVMPVLMQSRDSWCLAVAGRHERGAGYVWDGGDVTTVLTLLRHVLDRYPIRKDRVIVWGHSMGGAMTLATLAEAPELFAGGLTTASTTAPGSRHDAKRLCVFLGMEDRLWSGAKSVRAHVKRLAKKRGKGACAFFAVRDLGHDIPYDDYLGLGFDWILHGTARGGEAEVPRRSRGSDGEYRHILRRTEDGKRAKAKAHELLEEIRERVDAGDAYFPFEAACHSEDAETASCGGGLDAEDLEAFLPELPALEPGAVSEILESAQGLHLVYRCIPEDDEDDDEDG